MKLNYRAILLVVLMHTIALSTREYKSKQLEQSLQPTEKTISTASCTTLCDGNQTCLLNCRNSCKFPEQAGKCPICIKKFCGPDYQDDCHYENCYNCALDSSDQTPLGILACAECFDTCNPDDADCFLHCTLGIRQKKIIHE